MTHFPLISAGHAALRAVAADTTTDTLDQLDKTLADLPLTELTDSTEQLVRTALDMVGHAREHELFRAVQTAETETAAMIADGPRTPAHNHPAMRAVVQALGLCYAGGGDWDADSAYYRAWDRAMLAGADMVRAVSGFLYQDSGYSPRDVRRRLDAFSASARRAIAYHARDVARTALTMTSHEYGLFVIGARTPGRELRSWLRYIGSDTYQFEVTLPDSYTGAPAGRLIVTSYKTGKRVHNLPLSADSQRRDAVSDALCLI
ncbi:hypothetical protein [Streptomyces sp. NPDC093223]|uniref:hypothetical protein n=1 Tax=Streptomyces sp. NPDC093223 TaxID=3366033 RepID=UPI00380FE725